MTLKYNKAKETTIYTEINMSAVYLIVIYLAFFKNRITGG